MRRVSLSRCSFFALALTAACGGDEAVVLTGDTGGRDSGGNLDAGGTDTDGTEAGADSGGAETGLDATIDSGADTGSTCASEVTCERPLDCADAGLTNAQCVAGCCVEGTELPPCTAHLGTCEDEAQSTDAFFCDVELGQCLSKCDFDTADDTASSDCPLNSYCLAELTVEDPLALNGVCIPGDCDSNIFDEAACGGTGTCLPVGNGASFCVPGGTATEGQPCDQSDAAEQPASDICAPGLLCFGGQCTQPCNRRNGDTDCSDGLTCLGAFDVTPRNQPGLCGTGCDEFSTGSCAVDTEICGPILGRFGINEWVCIPGDDATGQAGDECEAVGCAEGLICVGQGEGLPPICLEMCNPVNRTSGPAAGCELSPDTDTCTPSTLSGFGFCQEQCAPYPRRPGAYDCEDTTQVCIPFVPRDDRPTPIDGVCQAEDGGTSGAGDACTNNGFLGGDCADFAVCLSDTEDDADAVCRPLCEPFTTGSCAEFDGLETCSGIPPLVGQLNFSFCTDAQTGTVGGRCAEEGLPCAADNSICLDLGAGPECLAVCRDDSFGFDDCAEFTGTECTTGGLNPDVVPSYMGLCQ